MKKLFKFEWVFGRCGSVESVFVATQGEVDARVGAPVYFGEILGKHSDVHGTLDSIDLVVLDADLAFVSRFDELFPHGFGPNPLEHAHEFCERHSEWHSQESWCESCWQEKKDQ